MKMPLERYHRAANNLENLFQSLNQTAFTFNGALKIGNKTGVYALFENDTAVHVGRTRNLKQRLKQQGCGLPNQATLAIKLTREKLCLPANYRTGSGATNMVATDIQFCDLFDWHKQLIQNMTVKFTETPDIPTGYLLEYYATEAYDLPINGFDTH